MPVRSSICRDCGGRIGPDDRRHGNQCDPCHKAYHRAYYRKNGRRWTESQLRRKYGVTLEWWDARMAENAGECPLCKTWDVDKWVVDHDHHTGEPRGVICGRCNVALGMAGDAPANLRAMADYLEAFYAR